MPSIHLSQPTHERLTALAAEHHLSRPKMVTLLLDCDLPAGDDPTHEEALDLLAGLARAGKVTAAVALERALRVTADAEPVLDELDELRERRRAVS